MLREIQKGPHALALACGALLACGGDDAAAGPRGGGPALTYYGDAKAIVDARCATCHSPGNIGPFSLTSYEDVETYAVPMRAAIALGTMPPWQPADECNDYAFNFDLTPEERQTLLDFLDQGAPEGDPADAPEGPGPDALPGFEADLSLRLPEAYTPVREPDDYRCQLIEWPADETRYVTGLRVTPDRRDIVHHVIVFLVGPEQVEQYRAYDEAEEGPGYTCYGGPTANDAGGLLAGIDPAELFAALDELGLTLAELQAGEVPPEQVLALLEAVGAAGSLNAFNSLGSWVPGTPNGPYPAGTGIRVEPGSLLVAQFHYNTLSSAPAADQSVIEIATAESVEREATMLGFLDPGWVSDGLLGDPMTIPAGAESVSHETSAPFDSLFFAGPRATLGLPEDAPLVVHTANHHMHELGRQQRTELRHPDGSTTCLLDIPDWDFGWQGSYTLGAPVVIRPGDRLWMGCNWDNGPANQPVHDGAVREPQDVSWGEGTTDEMCLGAFYVTGL